MIWYYLCDIIKMIKQKQGGVTCELSDKSGEVIAPGDTVQFNKELINFSNRITYNDSTGVFTFKKDGYYYTSFWIGVTPNTINSNFEFYTDGDISPVIHAYGLGTMSGSPTSLVTGQGIIKAKKGDTFKIVYGADEPLLLASTKDQGYINIFLIGE